MSHPPVGEVVTSDHGEHAVCEAHAGDRLSLALSLGIDRYTMARVLYPLTGLRYVGGLMRPGSEWAMAESELEKLPGFWRDIDKARQELEIAQRKGNLGRAGELARLAARQPDGRQPQ